MNDLTVGEVMRRKKMTGEQRIVLNTSSRVENGDDS